MRYYGDQLLQLCLINEHRKHHGTFESPWCFENSTDPIFQLYKLSFFGIRGVFFFKTTWIRRNTHVLKYGLR